MALYLIMVSPATPQDLPQDLASAVVSVVSLDDQGKTRRQGLGVVINKNGCILTSAALLAQGRGVIIKTSSGTMHLGQNPIHLDTLQDLALVQIEAEGLKAVPFAEHASLRPPEKVWVPARPNQTKKLKEARLVKTLSFSPRLVLLKMDPGELETDSGAPVFNHRGELVGMLHTFDGDKGKSGFQCYLALDRRYLPFTQKSSKETKELIPQEDHTVMRKASKGLPIIPLSEEIREEQKHPFESRSIAPHTNFWEGVAASLEQDWKGAQAKFAAALASPENLPEASYGRGVARYHQGDYLGAIKDLEEAGQRLPGYALAYLWLGKTRERLGNRSAGEKAYQQAVAAAPALSEAWFRWGTLVYQQGQLGRAREYLEKAGDDFPQAAQRWWYLGIIAEAQGNATGALEAFKQAIKLDPGFFRAYLEGGKLLVLDLGRPEEAAALLKEAVRLEPQNAPAHYYLGLAYQAGWNPAVWEQYFKLRELDEELAARLGASLERNR